MADDDNGEILLAGPPGCAVLDERTATATGRALHEASQQQQLDDSEQATTDDSREGHQ